MPRLSAYDELLVTKLMGYTLSRLDAIPKLNQGRSAVLDGDKQLARKLFSRVVNVAACDYQRDREKLSFRPSIRDVVVDRIIAATEMSAEDYASILRDK